jgi:hypothetical protein
MITSCPMHDRLPKTKPSAMGGEPPICFRSAGERSGRSADGLGWPEAEWPLSATQVRIADAKLQGVRAVFGSTRVSFGELEPCASGSEIPPFNTALIKYR